ncbi:hypothetical protein B0H10DRAFT_2277285 [Mycena sp. CBHHK59/15]|nr:hypothetical protein B0H10DRAFT_2277285 [Mycena sp. CBHHK59/15]
MSTDDLQAAHCFEETDSVDYLMSYTRSDTPLARVSYGSKYPRLGLYIVYEASGCRKGLYRNSLPWILGPHRPTNLVTFHLKPQLFSSLHNFRVINIGIKPLGSFQLQIGSALPYLNQDADARSPVIVQFSIKMIGRSRDLVIWWSFPHSAVTERLSAVVIGGLNRLANVEEELDYPLFAFSSGILHIPLPRAHILGHENASSETAICVRMARTRMTDYDGPVVATQLNTVDGNRSKISKKVTRGADSEEGDAKHKHTYLILKNAPWSTAAFDVEDWRTLNAAVTNPGTKVQRCFSSGEPDIHFLGTLTAQKFINLVIHHISNPDDLWPTTPGGSLSPAAEDKTSFLRWLTGDSVSSPVTTKAVYLHAAIILTLQVANLTLGWSSGNNLPRPSREISPLPLKTDNNILKFAMIRLENLHSLVAITVAKHTTSISDVRSADQTGSLGLLIQCAKNPKNYKIVSNFQYAALALTWLYEWAMFVSPFLLFWDRALKDNKIGPELFFETWYHLRAGWNNERPAVIQNAEDKIWKAVLDIAGGAEVSPRVGVLLAELQKIDFGEHNKWFKILIDVDTLNGLISMEGGDDVEVWGVPPASIGAATNDMNWMPVTFPTFDVALAHLFAEREQELRANVRARLENSMPLSGIGRTDEIVAQYVPLSPTGQLQTSNGSGSAYILKAIPTDEESQQLGSRSCSVESHTTRITDVLSDHASASTPLLPLPGSSSKCSRSPVEPEPESDSSSERGSPGPMPPPPVSEEIASKSAPWQHRSFTSLHPNRCKARSAFNFQFLHSYENTFTARQYHLCKQGHFANDLNDTKFFPQALTTFPLHYWDRDADQVSVFDYRGHAHTMSFLTTRNSQETEEYEFLLSLKQSTFTANGRDLKLQGLLTHPSYPPPLHCIKAAMALLTAAPRPTSVITVAHDEWKRLVRSKEIQALWNRRSHVWIDGMTVDLDILFDPASIGRLHSLNDPFEFQEKGFRVKPNYTTCIKVGTLTDLFAEAQKPELEAREGEFAIITNVHLLSTVAFSSLDLEIQVYVQTRGWEGLVPDAMPPFKDLVWSLIGLRNTFTKWHLDYTDTRFHVKSGRKLLFTARPRSVEELKEDGINIHFGRLEDVFGLHKIDFTTVNLDRYEYQCSVLDSSGTFLRQMLVRVQVLWLDSYDPEIPARIAVPLPEYCPNQDESKGLINIIGLSAINSLGIALDRRTYSKNPVSDEERLQLKTACMAYSNWCAIWVATHTLHDTTGQNLDLARDPFILHLAITMYNYRVREAVACSKVEGFTVKQFKEELGKVLKRYESGPQEKFDAGMAPGTPGPAHTRFFLFSDSNLEVRLK